MENKNHLNEVIDLVNNNSLQVHKDYVNHKDGLDGAIKFFKQVSKSSVCFAIEWNSALGIKTIPELVKLPYQQCWFESYGKDNDKVINGYLCSQTTEKRIDVLLFQKNKTFKLYGSFYIEDGDLITQVCGMEDVAIHQIMSWLTQSLSALNCCNIKRIEHKPTPSQQSVRRALGRHPLFSTWTLEIDLVRSAKEIPGEGGTHASPRLHLRRGHARQHRPGVWCWVQPHVVGDKSLGMIHKDYAAV